MCMCTHKHTYADNTHMVDLMGEVGSQQRVENVKMTK